MDEQISEDVFLCLDGETFVVGVRVVVQFHVEVGPDSSGNLSTELKDRESGIFVLGLAKLKLVHVELVFLSDDSLKLRVSSLDSGVPDEWLATENPFAMLALNQSLELLALLQIEISHDKLVHAEVHGQFCGVQNLVLEVERANVTALQEFARFYCRLNRVVVGVLHG